MEFADKENQNPATSSATPSLSSTLLSSLESPKFLRSINNSSHTHSQSHSHFDADSAGSPLTKNVTVRSSRGALASRPLESNGNVNTSLSTNTPNLKSLKPPMQQSLFKPRAGLGSVQRVTQAQRLKQELEINSDSDSDGDGDAGTQMPAETQKPQIPVARPTISESAPIARSLASAVLMEDLDEIDTKEIIHQQSNNSHTTMAAPAPAPLQSHTHVHAPTPAPVTIAAPAPASTHSLFVAPTHSISTYPPAPSPSLNRSLSAHQPPMQSPALIRSAIAMKQQNAANGLTKLAAATPIKHSNNPPVSLQSPPLKRFALGSRTASAPVHSTPVPLSSPKPANLIMKTPAKQEISKTLAPTIVQQQTQPQQMQPQTQMQPQPQPQPQSQSHPQPQPQPQPQSQSQQQIQSQPQPTPAPTPSQSAPSASRSPSLSTVVIQGVQYYLLDKVGQGGSASVYRVLSSDKKIFALKIIDLKTDGTHVTDFANEISLLERLKSQNRVIQLIAHETTKNRQYLHMIFELGQLDFSQFLSRRQKNIMSGKLFNALEIRYYFYSMCRCVETLHDNEIIHLDLKPPNFVFVDGELKIIDLGIAKQINHEFTANIVSDQQVGTLNYMSPEMLEGQNGANGNQQTFKMGKPSDLWSLGCILYQLVFGHSPFSKITNLIQKMRAITNSKHEIAFPTESTQLDGGRVDERTIEILRLCLQRESKLRPTIKEIFQLPYFSDYSNSNSNIGNSIDEN